MRAIRSINLFDYQRTRSKLFTMLFQFSTTMVGSFHYSSSYSSYSLRVSKHYNLLEIYDKYLQNVIKNHLFNTTTTKNMINVIVINFNINEKILMSNVKYINIMNLVSIVTSNFTVFGYMFAADEKFLKFLAISNMIMLNYYYWSTQLILHFKRNTKTSLMKTLRTLESMDTFEEAMISLMVFRSTNTWILDQIHVKNDEMKR